MFKLINKLKNRKGFTLVELIVVLAVLGVIMAIAVPRFTGVQEDAKEDSDVIILGNIAKVSELYFVKGDMPAGTYTGEDLTKIIEDDFPSGVEFQSEKAGTSSKLEDVTITLTDKGVASATIGGTSGLKYPE